MSVRVLPSKTARRSIIQKKVWLDTLFIIVRYVFIFIDANKDVKFLYKINTDEIKEKNEFIPYSTIETICPAFQARNLIIYSKIDPDKEWTDSPVDKIKANYEYLPFRQDPDFLFFGNESRSHFAHQGMKFLNDLLLEIALDESDEEGVWLIWL